MITLRIRLLRPLALSLALAGCSATAQVPEGIEFRSENWYRAAESGFVVAPSSTIQAVTDPTDAAVTFTNSFYPALRASLSGTTLASPDDMLYRVERANEEGVDLARKVRQALVEGQPTDPADLTALSRVIEHRYLMVSWIEESAVGGVDSDMVSSVYSSVGSSEDVRRFSHEKVEGRATAIVLDLWENEVLWRGAVNYGTAELYGNDGAIRRELEKARAEAGVRLAEFVY